MGNKESNLYSDEKKLDLLYQKTTEYFLIQAKDKVYK